MKKIRKFEIWVLKPIYFLILPTWIVAFASHGKWVWLISPLIGWFFLGFIGQGLHPFQSSDDLENGPLKTMPSLVESSINKFTI